MKKFEFAIRKNVLNDGTTIYTPVVRTKNRWVKENWQRIVKLYDKYVLLELAEEPQLTHFECQEHIRGYQKHLKDLVQKDLKDTVLEDLEEFNIYTSINNNDNVYKANTSAQ